jgi:hypothetical protein
MTKAQKAAYDRQYRKKNRLRLKAEKAAYFQRTYDPFKAAIERKKKMPKHVEYCRRPQYRAYKHDYDINRRASLYGPFVEAYKLLKELMREIKRQEPDRFERYRQAGRMAWNPEVQKRRRENAKQKTEQFIRSIGLNSA